MEVVLVIASALLLASVATAVALDRGPFAVPPRRPGTADRPTPSTSAGRPTLGAPPKAQASAGVPPMAEAGRWSGRDASVRACNDLQAQLRAGRLSAAAYRKAMADVAASHDRRHPLLIPPEIAG